MSVPVQTILQDPVIATFKERLEQRLGAKLKELWLFGSRARGDAHVDSDYDVLVVADGVEKELRSQVQAEGLIVLEQTNGWIGVLTYSVEHWGKKVNSPIGWNIRKEGIRIA